MTTLSKEVVREDRGRVRVLQLNRPPANSLSVALLTALREEIEEAGRDANVRCLVLASALPKYFAAGLDLDEMLGGGIGPSSEGFKSMIGAHRALARLGKPTVAVISGSALLGGFIVTLGCDWRYIAAQTGRVSLSEVRIGLSPTPTLIRLVMGVSGRPDLIKSLVLQGRTLRAQEAFDAGIVDGILPAAGFLDAVVQEAAALTKMAPTAYAAVQRAVRSALLPDEDALWKQSNIELESLLSGDEAKEGLTAMKEKRKPRWE